MVLLVGVALGGSVLATAQIVSIRADTLTTEALNHEADSFRTFAATPTGEAEQTVDGLLNSYLTSAVPDNAETYFTLLDGKPHQRSAATPPARLDTDSQFIARVANKNKPVHGWWNSSAGKVRYGVIPVRVQGDSERGALVIVEFRGVQAAHLYEAVEIFGIVAAVALAIAAIASWLIAGRVLAPVRLMRRTAEQIGEADLTKRIPVTGTDDVARLSATFNHMLDRLENSFSTQRRFLNDAAHELRTPITVVRGHLELMGDDPVERAETTSLVIDELDRMRRLVDELTELARSERPDFLTLGEVLPADLTIDVFESIKVTAFRKWTLDAVAEDPVIADGQRLTQAMMQLASNAVNHTGEGDRISVGSACSDGRLRLWVDDEGTGIAEEDAPHVFERFRRGSEGRRIDGAGLGLSIVDSIARAHGGHARLRNRPGPGTQIVIEIPAASVGADQPDDAAYDGTGTEEFS